MNAGAGDWDEKRRYTAPALDKGLDVIELLATSSSPMTLTQIGNRLDRSTNMIFRMIQALEYRGYIEQEGTTDGYVLTDKIFSLGVQQLKPSSLIELALPVMRRLSSAIGQSCHLSLYNMGEMVVVARIESSDELGFSVRVGHRRGMVQSASGAVLYAFQPEEVRRSWERSFEPPLTDEQLADWRAQAEEIRRHQVALTPSRFVASVTAISSPIMRGDAAMAVLTVAFIEKVHSRVSRDQAADQVLLAARSITNRLGQADGYV